MTAKKLNVYAPRVPGATPTIVATADTVAEAVRLAKEFSERRGDLRGQDVVVRWADSGRRVCFADPAR